MSYTPVGGRVCVSGRCSCSGTQPSSAMSSRCYSREDAFGESHSVSSHILTRWWHASLLPIAPWLELVTWCPSQVRELAGKCSVDGSLASTTVTNTPSILSQQLASSLHQAGPHQSPSSPGTPRVHSKNGDTQAHLGLLKGASELGLGNWCPPAPNHSREGWGAGPGLFCHLSYFLALASFNYVWALLSGFLSAFFCLSTSIAKNFTVLLFLYIEVHRRVCWNSSTFDIWAHHSRLV